MRHRFLGFCLLAALVAACGAGLGAGGVMQFAVDVTNNGDVPVVAAIAMDDGSVTRNIAPGGTTRLTGYASGPYSVGVVLEGPAKDAYVAKLESLKSTLQIVRQSHNSAAVLIALENLPLVEKQLQQLMSSGIPGCGGNLVYDKPLATVSLTNSGGLWRGTCGVSNYGSAGSGNEPAP
jgi:hypothetical protein